MDPFALTRSLIDIDSITGRENTVGEFLFATLAKLAASTGGSVERMEVFDMQHRRAARHGIDLERQLLPTAGPLVRPGMRGEFGSRA